MILMIWLCLDSNDVWSKLAVMVQALFRGLMGIHSSLFFATVDTLIGKLCKQLMIVALINYRLFFQLKVRFGLTKCLILL